MFLENKLPKPFRLCLVTILPDGSFGLSYEVIGNVPRVIFNKTIELF